MFEAPWKRFDVAKGAGESKRLEAQDRIRRKLAVLEGYALSGVPAGSFVPKSINQFREWEEDARGLQRIGSPNTMSVQSSPHNRHLIEAVKRLLVELSENKGRQGIQSVKRNGSSSKRKELDALRKKLAQLEDLTAKLVADWHIAQNEVNDLKGQLRNRERRNQDLNVEVSKLRSQLAALSRKGLRSVE